ncbi:MAG: hypothetical protein AAFY46_06750, partial [Planctomycetota bacterium]
GKTTSRLLEMSTAYAETHDSGLHQYGERGATLLGDAAAEAIDENRNYLETERRSTGDHTDDGV